MTDTIKPLQVGNITLPIPCFQAALSGYSDYAMRKIGRDHGAPLTFAGVMLDKVTQHKKALKKAIFAPAPNEHPLGGQLLGTDPDLMARAAQTLVDIGYDIIDLNFACPAPKVLRRGRGGALLQNPRLLVKIVQHVRSQVSNPLFLKLRIAYEDPQLERDRLWQICRHTVDAGVDALVIHGRTVLQRYRAKADWQILADLKRDFPNTPIIGSGDIFTAQDVKTRLDQTGLDGILIARGAIGNPWIFNEIAHLLQGRPDDAPCPTLAQQAAVILEHLDLVLGLYAERKAVIYFRKFLVHYCRRHPRRKEVMLDLINLPTAAEVTAAIKHWYAI